MKQTPAQRAFPARLQSESHSHFDRRRDAAHPHCDPSATMGDMCGIIGYAGGRVCKPLLLDGLERLEYRGYDSAGLSLLEPDEVSIVRAVGNLAQLKAVAGTNGSPATTGI